MHKLIEVHLREPERFKSIMIQLDGVDWIDFEDMCRAKGITVARAIVDFIEGEVKDGR